MCCKTNNNCVKCWCWIVWLKYSEYSKFDFFIFDQNQKCLYMEKFRYMPNELESCGMRYFIFCKIHPSRGRKFANYNFVWILAKCVHLRYNCEMSVLSFRYRGIAKWKIIVQRDAILRIIEINVILAWNGLSLHWTRTIATFLNIYFDFNDIFIRSSWIILIKTSTSWKEAP